MPKRNIFIITVRGNLFCLFIDAAILYELPQVVPPARQQVAPTPSTRIPLLSKLINPASDIVELQRTCVTDRWRVGRVRKHQVEMVTSLGNKNGNQYGHSVRTLSAESPKI